MILIRIRSRFRERASEWYCAALLFVTGTLLLHPSPTFNSPAYAAFQAVATETETGLAFSLVGAAWILGLIINGQMQLTTSAVRAACCLAGSVAFGLLALTFTASYYFTGIVNIGIGIYALSSVLGLYCLYWIMRTARSPH